MPSRIVVVTGAQGNLGRKLVAHLDATGGYELRLLDRQRSEDPRSTAADLSRRDPEWVERFAGADAVVHLAGEPSPRSPWAAVIPANIDMTFNVLQAATTHRVRRVVHASSNFVVSGHRFGKGRLPSDLVPEPTNPYGVSKAVGERLGKGFSEWHGVSVICLRIGFCQRRPGNLPGRHMRHGIWGQQMWLSDRDFCQAVEKAVIAEGIGFATLNVMSDNPGMRWDIAETRRLIGYAPEDGVPAQVTLPLRMLDLWQRGVNGGIRLLSRAFGGAR
jgi:NAD+ dependent glucose-6-phosphate dehydrogenase